MAATVPTALVAQARIPIVCESADYGYQAAYSQAEHVIYLSPEVCARVNLLASGARPRWAPTQVELAYALEAVAHEEGHAAGIPETDTTDGDAAAQCYGIAHVGMVARALGVAAGYARTLAGWAQYIRVC